MVWLPLPLRPLPFAVWDNLESAGPGVARRPGTAVDRRQVGAGVLVTIRQPIDGSCLHWWIAILLSIIVRPSSRLLSRGI